MKLNIDDKIVLIIYFSGLIMWLLTIATTNITYLTPDDFLGTAGKLPLYFWLSLILTLIGIIKNYNTKNTALFYLSLFLVISILFGTYPLLEPDGRHGVSYAVTGVSEQIVNGVYLSKAYIPITGFPYTAFPYLAYQGFPMFITMFTGITGITIESLVKFFPFFLLLITSVIVYALFRKQYGVDNQDTAFIAVLFFLTLCYWYIFLAPEILTYVFLPTFLILAYMHIQYPDIRYPILMVIMLLATVVTHLIAPIVIILFLMVYTIVNLVMGSRGKATLFVLSVSLFVGYLIYVAVGFFNSAVPQVISSYQGFDRLLDVMSVGDISRPMSLERKIATYASLIPLLISIVVSSLTILALFFTKKCKDYAFPISYFLGCSFLFLIPYGADLNIGRVSFFMAIGSSYFLGLLSKKYLKSVFILLLVFALFMPLAYSGGGTKVSVIPISELTGTKFFVETTEKDANYFSQNSWGVVNYQDPYRLFRQRHYSLWNPPLRDFDIEWKFKYLLYSARDHSGLVYYLGYDPIYKKISEINNNFNKIYESKQFTIYSRRGTS